MSAPPTASGWGRVRRGLRVTAGEARRLWVSVRSVGVRHAVVDRTADLLQLGQLARREDLEHLAGRVEAAAADGAGQTEGLHAELAVLRYSELAPLRTDLASLHPELAALRSELAGVRAEVAAVRVELTPDARQQAIAALQARVVPFTYWVRQVVLPENAPPISVVLPTFNRADRLVLAIESVLAQEYGNWQLVVVDDGSDDDTTSLAERYADDPRIVWIRREHVGVSRARNAALEAASGEIVCYLDDDNTMDRWWLKGVAWCLSHNPELEVLYGGRVMDEPRAGDVYLPLLQLEPWDRRRIIQANYVDMGTIAHRRGLPDAWFDESLSGCVDYDMFLRLTEHRTPLAVPLIASYYTSDAPHRISLSPAPVTAEPLVRTRWSVPRVLAYNAIYPLVSESYIGDEMRALTDRGVTLAWCTRNPMDSPVELAEPHYLDLDRAVAEFEPELLFLFWANFAHDELERLERLGLPFGLRVHSFDYDPDTVEEVRKHPLCVGVWAYPKLAAAAGAYPLRSLITRPDAFPEPDPDRPMVLSMSAGLPKKDWPTLVGAMGQLAAEGAECRIVMGRTEGFMDEGDKVRALVADRGADVEVTVNMPNREVLALLARTSVVVHTRSPGGVFGQPRSIVEGLCCGCSVIVPDRPEAEMAGRHARRYRTVEDIVAHGREVLAGGPAIAEEWADNRRFGREQYADPALADRFAEEVKGSLVRYRMGLL